MRDAACLRWGVLKGDEAKAGNEGTPLGLEGGDADPCAKLWGEPGQTWRVSRMQELCIS